MEINRTKIIATVGPSCSTPEMLQSLVDQGVNCFRVNLSHGTTEDKKYYFNMIQSISLSSGGRPAILGDLAGPKI
ncbi:MAG TPA: pyruvate kinase, partial [Candidatus Marinimicrobia bacterium]|nr:pyruvate kinase [Candidatus Neomarinimicrobiota bacterium]